MSPQKQARNVGTAICMGQGDREFLSHSDMCAFQGLAQVGR